ncbi:MAG: hypothetical protein AAFO01_16160 [Pseudomonadota bacterium]
MTEKAEPALQSMLMLFETVGRSLASCPDQRLSKIADGLLESGSLEGFQRLCSTAIWAQAVKEANHGPSV